MSKEEYKKRIKKLVEHAAFNYFIHEKEQHSKLEPLLYEELKVQPYLKETRFSKAERKFLVLLRSRCFSAKNNFKKLWRYKLQCRLGCLCDEDQVHIFTKCIWLNTVTNCH